MIEHLWPPLLADLIAKACKKFVAKLRGTSKAVQERSEEVVEEVEEVVEYRKTTKRTLRGVYRNSGQPTQPPTDVSKH